MDGVTVLRRTDMGLFRRETRSSISSRRWPGALHPIAQVVSLNLRLYLNRVPNILSHSGGIRSMNIADHGLL
jgi:hypothetical protein